MPDWKVKIDYENGNDREITFGERPHISAGDGMVRIGDAGPANGGTQGEVWEHHGPIKKITVEPASPVQASGL